MKSRIIIKQPLQIYNIKTLWNKLVPILKDAEKKGSQIKMDMSNVKTVDGAGLQTIMYLIFLSKEFPHNFEVSGIPDEIAEKLNALGWIIKREVKL